MPVPRADSAVRLRPVTRGAGMAVVAEWLRRPDVARWWGDPETTLEALRQHPDDRKAIIWVGRRPVGLVCWQTPPREELSAAGLDDLPDDLVDIDIMIGEPDAVGRGVGPAALRLLLESLRTGGATIVGLATAVANASALRAFEKAGFRPYRDFQEDGQDFRYLIRVIAPDPGR